MGRARRAARDDAGTAAVEFAIVAPLVFFLLFWTFEVGWELFELQGAQATATAVARDVGLDATSATDVLNRATCLALRNGPGGARLTHIRIGFSRDAGGKVGLPLTQNPTGYVTVLLTYKSKLAGVLPTPIASRDGTFSTSAVSRFQQAPLGALLSGLDAAVPLLPSCS